MSLRKSIRRYFDARSKPKDVTTLIKGVSIPHAELRQEYLANPLSVKADTFVLYRILGNDLPPRHKSGQSLSNLKFILENEPELYACEKRWILNRIVDRNVEEQLVDLLEALDQPYTRIPFDPTDYSQIPLDLSFVKDPDYFNSADFTMLPTHDQERIICALHRHRNNYTMNNNGARNFALQEGRMRAKWVMPFDGNCFFTSAGWEQIYSNVTSSPHLKYFVVPMCRLLKNETVLKQGSIRNASDEPQLIFRGDTTECFNEAFPYGRRPKVELFWRLGIPGEWDKWEDSWFDPQRRPLSSEKCAFGIAGWTVRLFSGQAALEAQNRKSNSLRWVARQESILALLDELDREHGVNLKLPYEPSPS
jgi:hypothetical protein